MTRAELKNALGIGTAQFEVSAVNIIENITLLRSLSFDLRDKPPADQIKILDYFIEVCAASNKQVRKTIKQLEDIGYITTHMLAICDKRKKEISG